MSVDMIPLLIQHANSTGGIFSTCIFIDDVSGEEQYRMESKDDREWQRILKFPVTYFKVPAGIWLQCVS
jgi:hypothetical protein